MGGSVNLQGGGQYSMPNIQGYGQNAANMGQSAAGFGSRFGSRGGMGNYGMPPQYDGGYGDYGGQYGGVSTGGKGFQQQPMYQPAPVLSPFTTSPQLTYDTSTGGKGFQTRQTPAQSVAYAPMNIPQMQFAQPSFYYPNIGNQMANLNANYGIGGLGAMGAFGNYGMVRRPTLPDQVQAYPALAPPPPPPPPTSTGGKGMRTQPPQQPPPPTPGYPPVGTGGKGFVPNEPSPQYPDYPQPDYTDRGRDDILRPVRPEDRSPFLNPFDPNFSSNYFPSDIDRYSPAVMPAYENPVGASQPFEMPEERTVERSLPTFDDEVIEQPDPTLEREQVSPFMGLDQRDLID